MRFDNQSALISGAATGLGRAYALALAERGARVFMVDTLPQDSPAVIELLRALAAAGANVTYLSVDISDEGELCSLFADIERLTGGIDLLINNAGIHTYGAFEHLSAAEFHRQLQVDLCGSFALTHGLWRGMMDRGYGRIVMTTGVSALYGDLHQSAFACAKMALVGLVNGLAMEGLPRNVLVNSLCPLAHTSMTEVHLAPQVKPLFSKEMITATLLFLLSPKAPCGRHLLAAGGSVSELCIGEHSHRYFDSDSRTPEAIAAHWGEIASALPIIKHANGEDQILAWARRSAHEQGVKLD
ncbi:SDR family NAD(P)-dependent oxidoreductase [Shewanella sp.]|uniref:SDR family NAD(P)-dependent oxidoreductase n=1 Tax=Shewanella sp. TaxID=50422 RepID=UPI0035669263